jgi:hypothetical protein
MVNQLASTRTWSLVTLARVGACVRTDRGMNALLCGNFLPCFELQGSGSGYGVDERRRNVSSRLGSKQHSHIATCFLAEGKRYMALPDTHDDFIPSLWLHYAD